MSYSPVDRLILVCNQAQRADNFSIPPLKAQYQQASHVDLYGWLAIIPTSKTERIRVFTIIPLRLHPPEFT
jgi:hypothetical protein